MISSHLAVCAFVILTLFGQPEAYGSEDESIGDGRFFLTRNMEVLGAVWDVQDSSQCCARCNTDHPTTQMTNYYRDEYDKYCECLKQNRRGYSPVTYEGKHYSSHLCANSCFDKHNSCAAWSSIGECTKNPGYMNINCAYSCGKCVGSLDVITVGDHA